MKYWLIQAASRNGHVAVKIEDQCITYRGRNSYDKTIRLNASGFYIMPARVAVAGNAERFYEDKGNSRWEKLISLGVTTAVLFVPVTTMDNPIRKIDEALENLKTAPLDFVLVPSVHYKRLTPSFIRYFMRFNIPSIEIFFDSLENCEKVAWDWVKQAKGPSSLSFIFRFPPAESKTDSIKLDRWKKSLSSMFPMITFEQGVILNKRDMQNMGIYPRKGTVARGDADYLLYYNDGKYETETLEEESLPYNSPDIVVSRGQVLKAGREINLKEGFGKCHNDILPGFLRSICDL